MFERFTERARRVIILAREEAGRLRHDSVGTEHVLLGLIRDDEGIASMVLRRVGLPPEMVRAEVERALVSFPRTLTFGEVPFTPQAKRVLELSIEEARQLDHNYIGPEHLLLGLMKEGQSIAAGILESLGARSDEARQATLALFGDEYDQRAIAAGKTAARSYFEEVFNRGDMVVADAILAPGIRFQYPSGDLHGLQAMKNYIAAVREAFPDINFSVEDLFGEGDRVAVRWSMAGTQTGPSPGKPPTGKRVTVAGNTLFRLQSGKIGEMWVAFDPARLA